MLAYLEGLLFVKLMTCDPCFVPAVPARITACWVCREALLSFFVFLFFLK